MAARLKEHYKKKVTPALMKEFGYGNAMEVPRIEKIVINMGVGEAVQDGPRPPGKVDQDRETGGQKAPQHRAGKELHSEGQG